MAFAALFLDRQRPLFFTITGTLLGLGVLVGWLYIRRKKGLSRGFAAMGLILVYMIAWSVFIILLLGFELQVVFKTLREWRLYFFDQTWTVKLLFFFKLTPLLLLIINLAQLSIAFGKGKR
ncbi:hypothetical protein M23134_01865 [Microscilla marina ATCC 23134]|uniref:Uncharacterized protein n=1 Tax=Microscilla marina ATCC 23134 TaxID=313606 RepID=A1ZC34_MICM2|nr:hypothetical protein M23134_01865 [Microscilla marina ATCC 23134]